MNTNVETFHYYATASHSSGIGHLFAYLFFCLLLLSPVILCVIVWKVWKKI